MFLKIDTLRKNKKITTVYKVEMIRYDETDNVLNVCTVCNDFVFDFNHNSFSNEKGVNLGVVKLVTLNIGKAKRYFRDFTNYEYDDFLNTL